MNIGEMVTLVGRRRWSRAREIQQVHAMLYARGLQKDNHMVAELINACGAVGNMEKYAEAVFKQAPKPNTHLCNSIISLLSPSPQAIFFYKAIFASSLRPDTYSISFALKSVLSDLHTARQLHCHALLTGLASHVSVATALVRMYSLCGPSLLDARKVFDLMPLRDVNLWNTMVAAYAKAGHMDTAMDLFHHMPQRNLISWTCIVSRLARLKRPTRAIAVFKAMLAHHFQPDEVVLLALLSASAQLSSLDLGKRIHAYILKCGFSTTLTLNNALVDMYAKSGSITLALAVFEGIQDKTVVSWTTIIAGLALHGLMSQVTEMLSRMGNDRVEPNEVTFMAVLSACSHSGLVEMGRWYFNNMASRFGVQPKIEHYGCIVDMLGRAGFVEEAMEHVRAMPFEANAFIWGSILAACNIHGNAEIGEIALQKLMVLEPLNSGNYTLLSNIYAKENLNLAQTVKEGHD